MSGSFRPRSAATRSTRFLELLDRYEAYLRSAGKKVYRSAPAEGERLFLALSFEHRQRLISRLETELAFFDEAVANGERLTDSPQLVWRYFRKTGYTPCSDIFGKITDSDIVELYGLEQCMFSRISISLTGLARPWSRFIACPGTSNSTREPEAERRWRRWPGRSWPGSPGHRPPDVGWHVVRECGEDGLRVRFPHQMGVPGPFGRAG